MLAIKYVIDDRLAIYFMRPGDKFYLCRWETEIKCKSLDNVDVLTVCVDLAPGEGRALLERFWVEMHFNRPIFDFVWALQEIREKAKEKLES